MQPLFSICIPTFNRAELIDATLSQIVNNKYFDERVEVVISDNDSTDNTFEVVKKYSEKYSNVKYFHNKKNVRDKNFWIALKHATGKYLKLQNDYYSFTDDGLGIILKKIKQYENKNIIFTNNNVYTMKIKKDVYGSGINDLMKIVSTYTTCINNFGIWRKDLGLIKDPWKYNDYMLNQVDWIYQLITQKPDFVIINDKVNKISKKQRITRTVKYNWFKIHIQNYYEIIYKYMDKSYVNSIVQNGEVLTKQTIYKDKDNCIRHFRNDFIITFVCPSNDYNYDKKTSSIILKKYCGETPRLHLYFALIPFLYLVYPLVWLRYKDNPIKRFVARIVKGE